MDRIPMTRQGYEMLKNELAHIKSVERPRNIQAIEEARAHGDLSENAEFDAAKDRQSLLEAKINELSYKLAHADVIDPEDLPKDKAVFGCKVVLENVETGDVFEYQLVGPDESNIEEGRISVSSPLGKSMLGRKPGEELSINAPGGKRRYEIIEIL